MCSAPSAPQPSGKKKGLSYIIEKTGLRRNSGGGEPGGNASSSNAGRTGTNVVGGGAGGDYTTILGGMDDERSPTSKKTLLGE